ncbi:MAG: outer membrane beta-barrel protein [bacterium]|jgi:outer membrane protein OmpA-like peptidoglycan-associated protein
MKYGHFLRFAMVAGLATGMMTKALPAQAQETGDRHPFNISLSPGFIDMEGDFPTKDGFEGSVKLGYDMNDWWSFEGGLFLAPVLKAQYTPRRDATTGGVWKNVNLLGEQTGDPGISQTTGYGFTMDALFHPTPWKRVDPYLAIGFQGIGFTDDMKDYDTFAVGLRGGGGVIYNINDSWGLRADYRAGFGDGGKKATVNATYEVGVRYVIGADVPHKFVVSGGPKDSDADGLTDDEENNTYGTNPHDPDTDHDGLGDFEEVRKYKTDPLNPDTDFDGLKDGAEVYNYHTEPLMRDTDGGGVADGHEVIEDGTDPRAGHGADDLQLFELNIQFDYDKDIIKPEYFKDLDIIGKVLQRDPGATARIEGHADKQKKSSKPHNDQLSERRAKACANYLATKWNINRANMTSVGYGFSRPKAKNDPIVGNPVNRRVEVYIRKSGKPEPTTPLTQVEVNSVGAVVPVETK